jgi:hypothetical protein
LSKAATKQGKGAAAVLKKEIEFGVVNGLFLEGKPYIGCTSSK